MQTLTVASMTGTLCQRSRSGRLSRRLMPLTRSKISLPVLPPTPTVRLTSSTCTTHIIHKTQYVQSVTWMPLRCCDFIKWSLLLKSAENQFLQIYLSSFHLSKPLHPYNDLYSSWMSKTIHIPKLKPKALVRWIQDLSNWAFDECNCL